MIIVALLQLQAFVSHGMRDAIESMHNTADGCLAVDEFKNQISGQTNQSTLLNMPTTDGDGREAAIMFFGLEFLRKVILNEIDGVLATFTGKWDWLKTAQLASPEPGASIKPVSKPAGRLLDEKVDLILTGMNLRLCRNCEISLQLQVIEGEVWINNIQILPSSTSAWRRLHDYTPLGGAQAIVHKGILGALRLKGVQKFKLLSKRCYQRVDGTQLFNIAVNRLVEHHGNIAVALSFARMDAPQVGRSNYNIEIPLSVWKPTDAAIGVFVSYGILDALFGAKSRERFTTRVGRGVRVAHLTKGSNDAWLLNLLLRYFDYSRNPRLEEVHAEFTDRMVVKIAEPGLEFVNNTDLQGFLLTLTVTNNDKSIVTALYHQDDRQQFDCGYEGNFTGDIPQEAFPDPDPLLSYFQASDRPFYYTCEMACDFTEAKLYCDRSESCRAIVRECHKDVLLGRRDFLEPGSCILVPRQGQAVPTEAYKALKPEWGAHYVEKKISCFETCAFMSCPEGYTIRPEVTEGVGMRRLCEGPKCDPENPRDLESCCWPENSVLIKFYNPRQESKVCQAAPSPNLEYRCNINGNRYPEAEFPDLWTEHGLRIWYERPNICIETTDESPVPEPNFFDGILVECQEVKDVPCSGLCRGQCRSS